MTDTNDAINTQNALAYEAAMQENRQNTSLLGGHSPARLTIPQPRSGQKLSRATRVQLVAEAEPPNNVRNVTFFVNGRRLGADVSSPFRVSWWAKDRRRFIITAEGTLRGGQTIATSTSVDNE